jgi:hypothetical protein
VGTTTGVNLVKKLKTLALIPTKDHWNQYKEELTMELEQSSPGTNVAIDFPSEPKQYPCLVAATLPPGDPTQERSVVFPRIICCYVYPKDAQRLLQEKEKAETSCHPIVELMPAEKEKASPETPEQLDETKDQAIGAEYKPSQMSTLLLALISELQAIGALKKDKFIQATLKMENWLKKTYTHNSKSQLSDIMEKFWETQHAG